MRDSRQILASRYGTALEKANLLEEAVTQTQNTEDLILMYGNRRSLEDELPRPTLLTGALGSLREPAYGGLSPTADFASIRGGIRRVFLTVDVPEAPFGMIPADVRGRQAIVIENFTDESKFVQIPNELPFAATQKVGVDATIAKEGELRAKVKYSLRGDNELTLRRAFNQTPKEKWKNVANLLAMSDGFRGQIVNVSASDPMETKDPFTVEYELAQPKFVDWSKKPVWIPALLPQIGLPDTALATSVEQSPGQIELGTPLEVQTTMALKLPPGTTVETPPGISVSRDYATFTSKYSSTQNTATASRHIDFLKRELPADRVTDYNAFVHAVQSDQAQRFTLVTETGETQ
jgi:hypothetical protein